MVSLSKTTIGVFEDSKICKFASYFMSSFMSFCCSSHLFPQKASLLKRIATVWSAMLIRARR